VTFAAPSLRRKFALAFLGSALVPLAVFAAVNYLRTSDGLNDIENRLVKTSTGAVERGLAQQQSAGIAPFTLVPAFARSVARGDRTAAQAAASNILQNRNLIQVEIRAADGNLLAQASILPSAARIGVGPATYAFQSYLGKPWVISSVPILAAGRQGSRLGTVIAAGQVDDARLRAVAQAAAAPASLYVDGNLAASSTLGRSRLDRLPAGSGRRTSGGWMTSFSKVRDAAGRNVAVLSVAVPDSAFGAIRSSMRTTAGLAFGLALAAALVAALLLAHQVTRPLRALSRAAEAMSNGEMRQHIPVTGKAEVAVVARAFNRMSERIAETVDELAGQIQHLSRDLADLSLVGETLAQSHDAKTELEGVAKRVQAMTRSDFCGIHLVEDGQLSAGIYAGSVNGSMLGVEELVRWTTAVDDVATTSSLAEDERLSELAARAATGISSVMVVPVVHQTRTIGAISVGSHRRRDYPASTAALLSTVASQVATALRHAETFKELEASYLQTVEALAAALEANNEYTAAHADTIARMALAVGRKLGLSGPELRRVEYVALLHDIGKIGISSEILDDRGPLSVEQRAVVMQHTVIGERIVSRIDYLRPLAPLVRAAHERWDGDGYPNGLTGEAIPLESRIAFVCDAFHAMTSDRPYRPRLSEAQARQELRDSAGSQFDPAVVGAFLEVWPAGDESRRQGARESGRRRQRPARTSPDGPQAGRAGVQK
jgi:HD-GYP domain-containing protein (c-di-GMP phosphodiesterase class II)/HAMP domain-containing protein